MIDKRIGIIGGGQLGKMICGAAHQMAMDVSVLDASCSFPAGNVCNSFVEGDITDFDDVLNFGKKMDILTIEIEKINTAALKELVNLGIQVHPRPEIIETIKDKALQKDLLIRNGISTASFKKIINRAHLLELISSENLKFPFVQKLRKDGYDGRGVLVCKEDTPTSEFFDAPSIVEEVVDIVKEIAVIICRNENGEVAVYDAVEMVFDPRANLLDYQIAPARINDKLKLEIEKIAFEISSHFNLVGILAIELFLTSSGDILVNEMAPRPHNSGHHTIEACHTSQYENLLRAIANMPLGNPAAVSSSILINLLGSEDYSGETLYGGIEQLLRIPHSHLHLYGKKKSKPYRKMGHLCILSKDVSKDIEYVQKAKKFFTTCNNQLVD